MNRRFPPDPAMAVARCAEMMRRGEGLRLLRARLGGEASTDDAIRMRRRLKQIGRRPVGFLDRELGIDRG